MNKRGLFLFLTLLLTLTTCFAQQDAKAVDILNKASAAYLKAGGVKASFSIQMVQSKGVKGERVQGSIRLKGQKFKLEVEDMTTWFDGSNQWVYLKSNKEVNVSNPTEEELLTINPINVFQLYKHGYTSAYKGTGTSAGLSVQHILLTPKDKYSQVSGIQVAFEKNSLRPVSIVITNKDKSGTTVTISSYQGGNAFADNLFVFPAKEYPSTQVIDLR